MGFKRLRVMSPRRPQGPLQTQVITSMVLGYLPEDGYLFFAAVDKIFEESWALSRRGKETEALSEGTTRNQLEESFDSGVLTIDRDKLFEKAIGIGRMDLLSRLMCRSGLDVLPPGLMHASARSGNLDLTKQIYETNVAPGSPGSPGSPGFNFKYDRDLQYELQRGFDAGIRSGNVGLIDWFLSRGCIVGCEEFQSACVSGRLEIVQKVMKNVSFDGPDRSEVMSEGMDGAIGCGHFSVVAYLTCLGHDMILGFPMESAVRSGNIEMIEYVVSHGVLCSDDDVDFAALSGHVNVLEYMKNNPGIFEEGGGVLSSVTAVYNAVKYGRIEVLEWFHVNGYEYFEKGLCEFAVHEGNMECLVWLRGHGVPLGNTLEICKERGRIKMWTWAKMNG